MRVRSRELRGRGPAAPRHADGAAPPPLGAAGAAGAPSCSGGGGRRPWPRPPRLPSGVPPSGLPTGRAGEAAPLTARRSLRPQRRRNDAAVRTGAGGALPSCRHSWRRHGPGWERGAERRSAEFPERWVRGAARGRRQGGAAPERRRRRGGGESRAGRRSEEELRRK